VFIKDKVLKDRVLDEEPLNGPEPPPSLKKIDAPPLEAILRALWITLVAFKQEM